MRLLVSIALCLALALAVACGNDDASTATPTLTPQTVDSTTTHTTPPPVQTEEPTATPAASGGGLCLASDLAGAEVFPDGAAGTIYYDFGLSNVSGHTCTVEGAPTISFADAAGNSAGVVVDYNTAACAPVDPRVCIIDAPIALPPGEPTPALHASPGQITVTVAIAEANHFDPLPTPTVQGHYLVLEFPGIGSDIRIPFAEDVTLIPSGQASLHGFGPSMTP